MSELNAADFRKSPQAPLRGCHPLPGVIYFSDVREAPGGHPLPRPQSSQGRGPLKSFCPAQVRELDA